MHRCHIPHAAGSLVELTPDQVHHLAKVLRLGVGSQIVVFDGKGHEWVARVATLERSRATVELVSSHPARSEPVVDVTLAVGLLKGDQMNTVVRDATALGVVAIAPFLSAHTAVSEGGDWSRALERWRRVASASAIQCGRAVVPHLLEVTTFDVALARAVSTTIVMCVEPAHAPTWNWDGIDASGPTTLLVGPEGGWAAAEVEKARASGARMLSLGPRTLRAEIAPTVALSALWTRWGWS